MENFKEKVLTAINNAEKVVKDYFEYVKFIQYRLEKTRELVKDIRIEPKRLGLYKEPTTIEEIKVISSNITGLNLDNTGIADKAWVELTLLQDRITTELNKLIDKNKPVQKKRAKREILKSKNGTTICEIEVIK